MSKLDDWNRNKIKQKSNYLKSILNETNIYDTTVLNDLKQLEFLLKGNSNIFESRHSTRKKSNSDRCELQKKEIFIPDIIQLGRQYDEIVVPDEYCFIERDIPDKLLLSVIHDFYESMGDMFFYYFKKDFKNRKTNIRRNYTSINKAIYIPSLNEGFIDIKKTETIFDFTYLIHEYAHLIQDRIQYRPNYSYPFTELLPLLLEMISLDYLENTFEFGDEIEMAKLYRTNLILSYAKELGIEYNYLNNYKKKKGIIENMSESTGLSEPEIFKLFSVSAQEKLAYVIPSLVDYELYDLFYKDKEKTIDTLLKIIKSDNTDYKELLTNSGIVLNAHSDDYIKQLKKIT